MYYDFNVPWEENSSVVGAESVASRLLALEKLGYGAVALNHTVEGKLPKGACPFGRIDYGGGGGTLRQYKRLTLVLSDPQQNHGINSANEVIRSYDIIAIQPETEKMFISACTNLEIDVISLDFSSRLGFAIKAGYLRQALERGVAFEIKYGPFVADGTARRNIIGNARVLLRLAGRSLWKKNGGLIISGGADAVWKLRAPMDVINLAGLMGVPAHVQRMCLVAAPEVVFMHASTRKHTHRACITIVEGGGESRSAAERDDMAEDFIALK